MTADPGLRLVAMCDLFADRVRAKREVLRKLKPDQVAVDDEHCFVGLDAYKKVIESCDVVLIANAAKFHPLHLRAAVEAGKHVFVEKPHAIDPPGVRAVAAACALAKQKGLSVLSGLQSRWDPVMQETVKRIHDGAIGRIVAIEENFLRAPYGLLYRDPALNELHYQYSNQYHFSWLSGDDVTQSLIHNLDRATWAMREQPPLKCHGLGGRSSCFAPHVYGPVQAEKRNAFPEV
jgi:predicted dehydrogenase